MSRTLKNEKDVKIIWVYRQGRVIGWGVLDSGRPWMACEEKKSLFYSVSKGAFGEDKNMITVQTCLPTNSKPGP